MTKIETLDPLNSIVLMDDVMKQVMTQYKSDASYSKVFNSIMIASGWKRGTRQPSRVTLRVVKAGLKLSRVPESKVDKIISPFRVAYLKQKLGR